MKVVPKNDRASYVEPSLPDERLDRIWMQIASKQDGPRVPLRAVWLAAALAACVVLLLTLRPNVTLRAKEVAVTRSAPAERVEPKPSQLGGEHEEIITFADGSVLTLRAHAQLTVKDSSRERTHLRLDRGAMHCTVAANGLRLDAGELAIELGAGEHDVERAAAGVTVKTHIGSGEVRDGNGTSIAHLDPGVTWSEAVSSRTAGFHTVVPKPSVAPIDPAQEAFARAERSRLDGERMRAADEYEQFYRAFGGDRRAGLAALEAARLRLRNGELERARQDFTFAKSHTAEPFREDAHAGWIETLAALGDASCANARDEFLTRYPQSPHREKVAKRCP